MRQCPTPPGGDRALITHRIDGETCQKRQRGFYHKCHRCIFARGEEMVVLPAVGPRSARNGIAHPGQNGRAEVRQAEVRQAEVLEGRPSAEPAR